MIADTPPLIAASLLAAVPARGRYAGGPQPAPRYFRPAKTHEDGPRAERRAQASPRVRPPSSTPELRAAAARGRVRVALAACAAREAR